MSTTASQPVKTIAEFPAASAEFQEAIRKIVRSHAVNELYGAQVFDEPAISLAPTPYAKWLTCRVAMEEYGHHVRFRELGEQIGIPAAELVPGEKQPLSIFAFPLATWEEFCVIKLLADLAEILQVEDLLHCAFHPLRNLARMTMPEERFHAQFGRDFCLELCRTPEGSAKVQDAIDRYFPMLPAFFGASGSRNNATYRRLGIKQRSNEEMRADYLERARALVEDELKLTLPEIVGTARPGGRFGRSTREDLAMTPDGKLQNPERAAFYQRIAGHSLAPLWEVLHGLVTPTPQTPCLPALWRYDEIRPFLMEAGRIITAREAERRVLILRNPGMQGQAAVTRTLFAGLQLILPGEVASAHRHTQSALRFVIEGEGAYTSVDGERTTMRPGDFIITPSWTWHDHGNDGDGPMVWLDGLDIPIVTLLDAGFAEPGNAEQQMVSRQEGDSLARYGSGLLPVDWKPKTKSSPIFNYPYARTREALATLSKTQEIDPCHGIKLRYVNPATGDFAMPTMATFMQLLPKGFASSPYRSTDGTVYVGVEGEGETRVGDKIFAWKERDIFVVPSWTPHSHHPKGEAVLFSFSDRPIQDKLGLWREERMAS